MPSFGERRPMTSLRPMVHSLIQDAWSLNVWDGLIADAASPAEVKAIAVYHVAWLTAIIEAKGSYLRAMAQHYDTCELICFSLSSLNDLI